MYGQNPIWFLKQPHQRQTQRWRETFLDLCQRFDHAQTDHHFLGVHLTYRYEQIPTSTADLKLLADWKPDCIVTLIDDAYCMRQRIHDGGYTSFTLNELLLWRAEEVLLGDVLARTTNPEKPPPNFVVSVKHPAAMLARLLFKLDDIVRLYLSYNISSTRGQEVTRKTTDTFRQRMHDQVNCAAFDPLTIDELPPVLRIPQEYDSAATFAYDATIAEQRWPILNPDGALSADDDLTVRYPLPIPFRELKDSQSAIDAQVKTRDIRMVDQAHYLVVYRPTLSGEPKLSSGVQGEVNHAAESGCPVIWYLKKGVDPLPGSPFVPKSPGDDPDFFYEPTEDRFWQRIASLRKDLSLGRDHFLH